MTTPRRRVGAPRVGFCARIDPRLAAEVRHTAAARGMPNWWVIQEALQRGLHLLPAPGDEAVPPTAYVGRRDRRPHEDLFVDVAPELVEEVRQARGSSFNQWWVVQEAIRQGLPLLPASEQEVLPHSA
jgi:hypothetical protein